MDCCLLLPIQHVVLERTFLGKHDAHVNGNNYSYVSIKTFFLSALTSSFCLQQDLPFMEELFISHEAAKYGRMALNGTRSGKEFFKLHKSLRTESIDNELETVTFIERPAG